MRDTCALRHIREDRVEPLLFLSSLPQSGWAGFSHRLKPQFLATGWLTICLLLTESLLHAALSVEELQQSESCPNHPAWWPATLCLLQFPIHASSFSILRPHSHFFPQFPLQFLPNDASQTSIYPPQFSLCAIYFPKSDFLDDNCNNWHALSSWSLPGSFARHFPFISI